jgi:predicted secreted hydrolase
VATLSGAPALAGDGSIPTTRPSDPLPIVLPADDGPHDRLTEWWYYTGHLAGADGRRFGFEFVVFRALRSGFPLAWASHLALTDGSGRRFLADQRLQTSAGVDRSRPGEGFDVAVTGDILPGIPGSADPWRMSGALGRHRLTALDTRAVDGTRFGLDLELDDGSRESVLHDLDGWVVFGSDGGSYYYSRPRMAASGHLTIDGEAVPVSGTAWFDHQWGDFTSVGAGWDWFAVNLDDGTDLTVSVVRDPAGEQRLMYGTLADAEDARHLPAEALRLEATSAWTSPRTGIRWPSGWRLEVPDEGLVIDLAPTLLDQELDTRSTTGVIYWEGSQVVSATRDGQPLGGEAYVELTGYTSGASPSPTAEDGG